MAGLFRLEHSMARRKNNPPVGSGKGQATIFDVAQRAGVSIKTVSRVVNREQSVREQTRAKVAEAIEALNYQPNAAARGLSSKRSYVIGLIYENTREFSYLKHVLDGVLEVCESQGYTLLLRPLTLPNDRVLEQIRAFAVQARVDGVVLPAPIADISGVEEIFRELDVPVAAITPKSPQPAAINVLCDDSGASHALTELLIEQGHRRIGFIKGHPDHRASAERFKGYRAALKAHGVTYNASLVRQGYFTFDSGRTAAEKLLGLEHPPTAIVATNDDMAAGVAIAARERGLDIPADLSIVGFDDTPVASHMWPPLTTARQPIAGMAEAATFRLIQRLRGEDVEDDAAEVFCCEVIVRRSTEKIR